MGSDTISRPCHGVRPRGSTSCERSELGAQARARRQFPPAIHVHTGSDFLTLAAASVSSKKRGRGAQTATGPKQERRGRLSLAVALESG